MSGAGARRVVEQRPLVVTGVASSLIAAAHAAWIWRVRRIGAFDADEATYLATALRSHQALGSSGVGGPISEVGSSATGPLLPLLSVLPLELGPADPRTAILVQPVLLVVAVVAVAGIALRLVRPGAAVLTGLCFASLPTTILASQSYWFGMPVAAFGAASTWALLASERGRARSVWWVGPLLGAMLLSRTMAIAFLPGALLAGLVHVRGEPVGRRRLVGSWAVGALVALPWYWAQRSAIFGYLFDFGFTERAEDFGGGSLPVRVLLVPAGSMLNVGVVIGLAALLAGAIEVAAHRGHVAVALRRWAQRPERAALLCVVVPGYLALMSTKNQGGWFDLVLIALWLPLATELIVRRTPRFRRVAGGLVGVAGVAFAVSAWWLVPFGTVVPLPSSYELPLSMHDERFLPTRRDEQFEAAAEWAAANEQLIDVLTDIEADDGPIGVTMTGNVQPFNSGTLELAGRLRGLDLEAAVPDTSAPPNVRADDLTPRTTVGDGGDAARVIVAIDHPGRDLTLDVDADGFVAQARALGWTVWWSRPLPAGATLSVLRYEG